MFSSKTYATESEVRNISVQKSLIVMQINVTYDIKNVYIRKLVVLAPCVIRMSDQKFCLNVISISVGMKFTMHILQILEFNKDRFHVHNWTV